MITTVGSGSFIYEPLERWEELPALSMSHWSGGKSSQMGFD